MELNKASMWACCPFLSHNFIYSPHTLYHLGETQTLHLFQNFTLPRTHMMVGISLLTFEVFGLCPFSVILRPDLASCALAFVHPLGFMWAPEVIIALQVLWNCRLSTEVWQAPAMPRGGHSPQETSLFHLRQSLDSQRRAHASPTTDG